ncbi:hypothetical protein CYMTET_42005 [Cymbomonas tetramitiformis]|uniref:Uncharacterized protein n=1 Tax=Cymbomonas tetramitiformis TaxID=36881 RepID=A0AAE0C731_9CHLO|nr:hypothetical protein CYMTET_42005 [Cymbomonas tetramitiformis]
MAATLIYDNEVVLVVVKRTAVGHGRESGLQKNKRLLRLSSFTPQVFAARVLNRLRLQSGGPASSRSSVTRMTKSAGETEEKRASSPVLPVARFLASFLQALVLGLEQLIEWLGYEPERRWENALFLRGVALLETQPDNTIIMDAAAELLAELGDAVGAKELLTKSVELAPEQNHGKYVLMGHLENGQTAIGCFEKALQLLQAVLEQASGDEASSLAKRKEVKKQLSAVMASMAKVYLTDCFMEKNSNSTCEELLDGALLWDSDNPEACQALADLRMTQNRRGEALVLVRRTLEVCNNLGEGLAPSYDFRTVTARLLVELSQYELAVTTLEDLVREDDEDTEVMYLLGLCYMLLHMPSKCRNALSKAKTLLERTRSADTGLMEQINGLLTRRSIRESEKEQFWNPRWWVKESSGKGEGESSVDIGSLNSESSVSRAVMKPNPNDILNKDLPI